MKNKPSNLVEIIEDLEELKGSYRSLKEVEMTIKKAKLDKKKNAKNVMWKAVMQVSKAKVNVINAESEFERVKEKLNETKTEMQKFDLTIDPELYKAMTIRISYIF